MIRPPEHYEAIFNDLMTHDKRDLVCTVINHMSDEEFTYYATQLEEQSNETTA
jgi:hypothetical protein